MHWYFFSGRLTVTITHNQNMPDPNHHPYLYPIIYFQWEQEDILAVPEFNRSETKLWTSVLSWSSDWSGLESTICSKCDLKQTHTHTYCTQTQWNGSLSAPEKHLAHIRNSISKVADILLPYGNFSSLHLLRPRQTFANLIHPSSHSSCAKISVSLLSLLKCNT